MIQLTPWIKAAADVLFPRRCTVCGKTLDADERHLCRGCLAATPRTGYHLIDFNPVEQLAAGLVPIERATGFFFYDKQSPYVRIIHDAKYRNVPQVGRYVASVATREIAPSGFFDTIDAIVPVPLHFSKRAKRGYNQTEYIARGISEITGICVLDALRVLQAHGTQTSLNADARRLNTGHNFAVKPRYAERLRRQHILVVDDVITTGSTLLACAEALRQIEGVTVSLFTLAVAHHT